MRLSKLFLFCIVFIPSIALAHGPARVKLLDSIEIAAPPEKVWGIIEDFCSIKDWNPMITACESDNGSQVDAVRTITFENGAKIKEKLAKHDPERFRMQYYMVEKNPDVYPVSSHGVMMTVKPGENGGSILEMKGNFYRLFQGPTPPPGQTDDDGKAALMKIDRAGLENIKKLAEQ